MTPNFSYSQNKFSFNLKLEFLKRINFLWGNENEYQHFKINSLNEISSLQLLFCQQVPLINNNSNNNNININSIDDIVKRILIDGYGGNSSHLNLIFGLFLNEIGIKVKLIKTEINKNNNCIHYSNIIEWSNGNQYLVDVGLQTYSCFQPIEISFYNGGRSNVKFNKNEFRIRRLRDGTFIYEVLLLNNYNNNNFKSLIEIYQPICHFNKNYNVSNNEIINIYSNINNNNNNTSNSNNKSLSKTQSSPSISLFKLFDKGYYLLENDDFYMVYFNNSKKDKKIQLNNYYNSNITSNNNSNSIDNYHIEILKTDILNKYFNIKI